MITCQSIITLSLIFDCKRPCYAFTFYLLHKCISKEHSLCISTTCPLGRNGIIYITIFIKNTNSISYQYLILRHAVCNGISIKIRLSIAYCYRIIISMHISFYAIIIRNSFLCFRNLLSRKFLIFCHCNSCRISIRSITIPIPTCTIGQCLSISCFRYFSFVHNSIGISCSKCFSSFCRHCRHINCKLSVCIRRHCYILI